MRGRTWPISGNSLGPGAAGRPLRCTKRRGPACRWPRSLRSVAMKIFFSVGEPSGDLHGANLIRELKRQAPVGSELECVGYGGPLMEEAGCRLHEDLTKLAVMWFLRVLLNLH